LHQHLQIEAASNNVAYKPVTSWQRIYSWCWHCQAAVAAAGGHCICMYAPAGASWHWQPFSNIWGYTVPQAQSYAGLQKGRPTPVPVRIAWPALPEVGQREPSLAGQAPCY
jgi:hypothetical protein